MTKLMNCSLALIMIKLMNCSLALIIIKLFITIQLCICQACRIQFILIERYSEWVSECNFSAISWREQWNDDDFRFVLDQHAVLDFYSASSLKQYCIYTLTHYISLSI
jgi:hypothetical protein